MGVLEGAPLRCTLECHNVYEINQGKHTGSLPKVWLQVPLKAKLKALIKD